MHSQGKEQFCFSELTQEASVHVLTVWSVLLTNLRKAHSAVWGTWAHRGWSLGINFSSRIIIISYLIEADGVYIFSLLLSCCAVWSVNVFNLKFPAGAGGAQYLPTLPLPSITLSLYPTPLERSGVQLLLWQGHNLFHKQSQSLGSMRKGSVPHPWLQAGN